MKKLAYQGEYFSILLADNGVEYVYTGDAALIVPLTSGGKIILSREPAPAFKNELVLVLPGGTVDPGEAALETANRELQEEIGWKARSLDLLGELHPFAKYLHTQQTVYLARDLEPSHLSGDEDYEITTELLPLEEIEAWVSTGRLQDSSTIAALFLARTFLMGVEKEA